MKEKQEIVRQVRPDGTIEVSITPLVTTGVKTDFVDESGVRNIGVVSEQAVRALCNIPDNYNTVMFKPNNWVQQVKVDGDAEPVIAWQSKGSFAPPKADQLAAESLLAELRDASPVVPAKKYKVKKTRSGRRLLEVSIMDAHFGLACFAPGADVDYDLEIARTLYLQAIEELVELAKAHGNIDEIAFVVGNDVLHGEPIAGSKGLGNGTSSGTLQPDMASWSHVYIFAEKTLKTAVEMLAEVARVRVVVVPGNHDAVSSFTLGRVLNAYFENNANVQVDASQSPYKFVEWGVNLIGFEHGHSIPPIRLAALMANENPEAWARTQYREWHLGDQHRKGVGKPAMFEEQGVSVEYLPSITAPNDWHRMKAFNHQKRGALAFLWDDAEGPIARIGVNLLRRESFRD